MSLALETNTALVKLECSASLSIEALAALAQNRKLAELWVSVARVVRHGEAPGWQVVVAALTPHNVLVKVFCFLWPRFRVRPGLVEPVQLDAVLPNIFDIA